jgi:hypothetical protein
VRLAWQRLVNSALASLRAHSLFLLQISALKFDLSDIKGKSKCDTFKIRHKTSEIKATIFANLAPTRPMFLIAAAHSSDQLAADKQALSLLPARASILNARTLRAATRGSIMYVVRMFFRASVCAQGIACTLDSDRQDMALTR